MAISPSYLSRTVAGFFDTENIGIFGMIATPFFFLRSIRKENSLQKSVIYAVAGGLAMGYAFASWGAARYISSLLLLYIGVMLVLGKDRETPHNLLQYHDDRRLPHLLARSPSRRQLYHEY